MGILSVIVAQSFLTAVALLRGRHPGDLPRGHFYYAQSCGDCFYKGEYCGCEPATEYLACVTKHCSKASAAKTSSLYEKKCHEVRNQCTGELDIECKGPETSCKSKFSQGPNGGIGFTIDRKNADDTAFCGPFGKCIGKYQMKVNIHKSVPYKAVAPAPAPAALDPLPPPLFLVCGIGNSSFLGEATYPPKSKDEWILCHAKVTGATAKCKLPMQDKRIQAGDSKRAFCVLKDGVGKKDLTEPAWVTLTNVHDESEANAAAAEAPPPKVAAQKPAPKVAAKKEPVEAKKGPKFASGKENEVDEFGRPPWMKDKPRPEEPSLEEPKSGPPKPAAKQAVKKAEVREVRDGEPPWMENNNEPPPPSPM